MKKIIIIILVLSFFIIILVMSFFMSKSQSQEKSYFESDRFKTRVEIISENGFNVDSKGELEKRFFGDSNSLVEYFCEPSFFGSFGFRIKKNNKDTNYVLEIKYISNFEELQKALDEKYPSIGISFEDLDKLSKDSLEKIRIHNNAMFDKRREEKLQGYIIQSLTFPVSKRFAKLMYKKMVWCIQNFEAKGDHPVIPKGVVCVIQDGNEVVFRTVVNDEVWSLKIHVPYSFALDMSDLCEQIFNDAIAGKLDESKYISVLKSFEN